MESTKQKEEEALDRQCLLMSAASWYLASLEGYLLAPLEAAERTEFRKSYLHDIGSSVEKILRSEPFLELLNQTFGSPAAQRHEETAPGGEKMEEIQRLLETVVAKHLQEATSERPASPAPASRLPKKPAQERGATDQTQSEQNAAQQDLLSELRETNRQLRELLALQRQAAISRNGEENHLARRNGRDNTC